MGQNYVGSEHILLSLMREIDSVAVRILIDADVDPQEIFTELLRILSEDSPISKNHYDPSNLDSKGSSSTPTLNQFGKDLTELAKHENSELHFPYLRSILELNNYYMNTAGLGY